MKILLVGGGSGGPVAPLLAVASEIKKSHPKARFLLVGSKNGPERQMAKKVKIEFEYITAGKLRRYISVKNLITPFLTLAGFYQAIRLLKKFKPDCVFGAGSFVQVPVVWAAWFLKIPVVLHQQDVLPSLANRLCELAAKKITVTFDYNLKSFSSSLGIFYSGKKTDKVILTGNPFREELKDCTKAEGLKRLGLKDDMPTLLVMGGGTGSDFINKLVQDSLPELCKIVQVIHSTGKRETDAQTVNPHYHPFEFIEDMAAAYAASDIVLARAGLSTITELSYLEKVSIIIPMPKTHQEYNAAMLNASAAAFCASQGQMTAKGLPHLVRKILFNLKFQQGLSKNIGIIMPHKANEKIAEIITKLANKE